MTKLERKEYIKLYMREWRNRHPGYNYVAVKSSNQKRRDKLGEAGWRAFGRAKYRKYRDRILKSEKIRRSKIDPEVLKESRKQWWKTFRAKHDEKIKADRRDYYARNREHTLARKRNTIKANQEKYRSNWCKYTAVRRARKRAATIGDLTEIAKIYERRDWWRRLHFDVAVDHIISLAKGGTHEPKNLQIIYDYENNRKSARSDYKPRVVFV